MMEPTEDEIRAVAEVTGLDPVEDRSMVLNALQNNSRNVDTVINEYYDDADKEFRQRYDRKWDDTMFGADRDGTANNAGIAFHIESPNQNDVIQGVSPPPEGYGPGAPSRPPSRSNNRSPLGRLVDWAADASGPNSQAQAEDDLARALRASAQEAGIMSDQETGVVESTSVAHFGPANRTDYDNGNWAMVPTKANQTTLESAPAPALRKRAPDAPAFLVQGLTAANTHGLGSLLTIMHQIPLARNILLETGSPAPSYGHNSEWWKGQEILPPHVLARLQTDQLQWGSDDVEKPNFEEEIHRLMALLDQTERAYGTVSVLTDLIPWSSTGAEKQFYELLAERNREIIEPLTQTAVVALAIGDDAGDEEAKFGLLDIELQPSAYQHITTLYEAIDHVMWSDMCQWNLLHEDTRMAMFRDMGEVLVLKFCENGPTNSIEIPVELYPERWLSSRKDEARQIQKSWCEASKIIASTLNAGNAILQHRDAPTNKITGKADLLKKTEEQWRVLGEYLQSAARFKAMEESGFDTDKYPDYHAAPCAMGNGEAESFETVEAVLKWTDRARLGLEEKLQDLELYMDKIRAKQRFLGRLLTVPDKPGRPKPMTCKKYLLRGVATSQDVVYVCQRSQADLIELGDAPKPLDQWWRLAYAPQNEQPVKSEKVEVELVLRDMWHETKTPMLIYATEDAMTTPQAALSTALDRFVRADNKAFRQELNRRGSNSSDLKRSGPTDPMSPSKRKHRADSPDSMDSNRASIGSDGQNAFQNPFDDAENTAGTEMMEMSSDRDEIARSVDVESTMGGMDDLNWNAAGVSTRATVTPGTPQGEAIQTDTQSIIQDRGDQSRTMSPEAEEARSPEMQERPRPPAFVTLSRTTSGQKAPDPMDMEIPDHQ